MNDNLMGFKGECLMGADYFFCPYVPLVQTPTVIMPRRDVHPEENEPFTIPPDNWKEEGF